MDEIIDQILSLPSLVLESSARREFMFILERMESFSLAEFQHVYNIYFKQKSSSTLHTLSCLEQCHRFIAAWAKIAESIGALNRKVQMVWKRIDEGIMGADDCIPVMIRLMPKKAARLNLLIQKLDESMQFFSTGAMAYAMITLHSAATFKYQSLPFKKTPSYDNFSTADVSCLKKYNSMGNLSRFFTSNDNAVYRSDKYDTRADIVVNDLAHFHLLERFNRLYSAYTFYRNYLETEISYKLCTESPDIYAKFSSMEKSRLFEAITTELRGNLLISPALNQLIEKYICVQDFDLTLTLADRPLVDVLRLFSEKFTHHSNTLIKNPNKFNVSAKSIHSYYMVAKYAFDYAVDSLPISTAEKAFYAAANDLCAYMNRVDFASAASSFKS